MIDSNPSTLPILFFLLYQRYECYNTLSQKVCFVRYNCNCNSNICHCRAGSSRNSAMKRKTRGITCPLSVKRRPSKPPKRLRKRRASGCFFTLSVIRWLPEFQWDARTSLGLSSVRILFNTWYSCFDSSVQQYPNKNDLFLFFYFYSYFYSPSTIDFEKQIVGIDSVVVPDQSILGGVCHLWKKKDKKGKIIFNNWHFS